MEKFLTFVINEILKEHHLNNIHSLTIVVPSERSKWHLKQQLIKSSNAPFILPEIKTIQSYFNSISDLFPISNMEAKFILYKEAIILDSKINFKEFQNQSNNLLKSFNDIERNLINHKTLFNELNNITAIDDWSLNEKNLSVNQQNFIFQFKKTGQLFESFKKTLIKNRKGTSGIINREIAENPIKFLTDKTNIYFLGLNALSRSEEAIIDYLQKNNDAKIIVDVDEFYVQNKNHEAGYFYRKHFAKQYNPPFNKIKKNLKNINIYSSSTANQQVEIVFNIIKNSEKNYAVLLMDESLGPLVYKKLYDSKKSINFSSGLKNKYFENHKLVSFLLESQSIFKLKKINYQWIESVLNFSIVKRSVNKDEIIKLFIDEHIHRNEIDLFQIKNSHLIFNKIFNALEKIFNADEKNTSLRLLNFLNIIEILFEDNQKEINSIQLSKGVCQEIGYLIEKYKLNLNQQDFIKLFLNEAGNKSIVIQGKNDSKIQILGLLESRIIDYENIIFMSCNEEFLPSKSNLEDMFPEDLKKYLGIPSGYEKEAISAYYFYRCFHYAKNIDLIYVKEDGKGLNYNEPSRYIRQVEKELGDLKNIKLVNYSVKVDNIQNKHLVESNPQIKQSLIEWMSNGVSPSAIIKYNNCPLDFYLKYVAKIKEKKQPSKYLNPSEWGIAVHKTLENLFYKNRTISQNEIKKIKKELKEVMLKSFSKIFLDKRFLFGKNALTYHHYEICIENLLETEIKAINEFGEYKILKTEDHIDILSTFKIDNESLKTKFLGIIDRIDLTDQGIRLVDYKTGMVNSNEISLNNFDQLFNKTKAFQLFFYGLLWNEKYQKIDDLSCQIISLKNTFQPHLELFYNKNKMIKYDTIDSYRNWLFSNLELIYNTKTFNHVNNSLYCELC